MIGVFAATLDPEMYLEHVRNQKILNVCQSLNNLLSTVPDTPYDTEGALFQHSVL